MNLRWCILLAALLLTGSSFAQSSRRSDRHNRIDSAKIEAQPLIDRHADTLDTGFTERNQRLYDSIASKSRRRAVPRFIYNLLFRNAPEERPEAGNLYDESRQLAHYAGKIIGEIRIVREEPFRSDGNWIERTSNKLHTLSSEGILRRELLFRSGQRFDPELVVRSQRLMISRSYISEVDVAVTPDPADPERVDITLYVRDKWSIQLEGGLYSDRRAMIGLSDHNILGTGTRFKVETYLRRWDFAYGGNVVGYEMPNLLGSFFSFEIEGGRNFYEDRLRIQLNKEFLKPTDYEVGISYTNMREKEYFVDRDSSELIKVRRLDLWGGWSHYLPAIRSSIYLTGHYNSSRFVERPGETSAAIHPALHDRDEVLGGIGLYRERLYKTNMVYGFGRKEYIATGYRAELLGGHTWGEFCDRIYLGANLQMGGITRFGYLVGGVSFGTQVDPANGALECSAVDLDLLWFSRLLTLRRNRIRQFVSLNYTQGWNRLAGYEELLRFTNKKGLQTFDAYVSGTNRLIVNTETVMFTPIQPLGYRFAFFGFIDAGTIGFSANPFRNAGYTSFGIGLRVRNERIVLGTLQVRLGVAFGRGGLVDCDWISLSNAKNFEEYRFQPSRPERIGFQ